MLFKAGITWCRLGTYDFHFPLCIWKQSKQDRWNKICAPWITFLSFIFSSLFAIEQSPALLSSVRCSPCSGCVCLMWNCLQVARCWQLCKEAFPVRGTCLSSVKWPIFVSQWFMVRPRVLNSNHFYQGCIDTACCCDNLCITIPLQYISNQKICRMRTQVIHT